MRISQTSFIRTSLFLFVAVLAACGGGGSDGSSQLQPPAANLSGTWNLTNIRGNNTCGDPVGASQYWTGAITHAQGSNNFTLDTVINGINYTYTGTISGSSISMTGSYPDAGATTSINFSGTVNSSAYPMTLSGSTSWAWSGNPACSGTSTTSGVLASGGISVTTIASMPYNGAVTGTANGYYKYTTVGTISSISMTNLTADLDPKVYTDATFATMSTNWSCTTHVGTASDTCTAITAVPAGTVLYIMARSFASSGASFRLQ